MDISEYLNKLNDCKIIKDIKRYLARTIWVILAFIILGLCLSVQRSPFISHLGMGLVIAGIVGFYLEVFEVKKFVEERLAEVLTKDEYLESLNEKKLTDLIYRAMIFLAERKLSSFPINDDTYELDDFVDRIQGDAIDNLGTTYRKNFNQIIDYCKLDDDEIRALGANPADLEGQFLVCIKTTTRFHLIASSKKENEKYEFRYEIDLIKGLKVATADSPTQLKPETLFKLSVDDDDIIIDFDNCLKPNKNEKSLSFNFIHEVKLSKDNSYSALIQFQQVEYKLDKFDLLGRLKSNMNYLTHGANIHFSSRHALELDAEFFGITGEWDNATNKTNNFISIDYDGWAFPQDGYFIYWEEKNPGCPS
jgi:hypothetical protein